MTFMQQPRHLRTATSRIDVAADVAADVAVAVDQMFIASPTSRGFSRKAPAKKVANEIGADPRLLPRGPVDVFAGWYACGGNNGRTDFAWGWEANVAVRVDAERRGKSRFPTLAVGVTLSMPGAGVAPEAVSLMGAALGTGLSAGVAHSDKTYWATSAVDRLDESAFRRGFTPSTANRVDQLGGNGGPSTPQPVTSDTVDGRRPRQAFVRGFEGVDDVSRRPVRGFAAGQVFVTILLSNYNLSAIAAFIRREIRNSAMQTPTAELPSNIRRRDSEWHNPYTSPHPAGILRAPEDGAASTT